MIQIDHNFTGTAIIRGDSLQVIRSFPDALFGGIICQHPLHERGVCRRDSPFRVVCINADTKVRGRKKLTCT
ncbi:hypothetical protein FACS1894202_13060 [Clostridia bacterium]|nr:hypothetical protein FACS1894202_13060 [Clostridia bacterium]